ncbi:hypothetical protein Tco_0439167 [Tanacetum coccineum]
MGGSSSQPRTEPAMSPINAFSVKEPNPHESQVEQVTTSPTKKKKKKPTRNRQKRHIQIHDAPRQIAWTTEEEIVLCKGWVAISKNSEHDNARKKDGFWCEVLGYIESKTKTHDRRTYENGAGDEDYVQRAMIHYQTETGLPFKFRHCWDVSKNSLKLQEIAFPNFNTGSEGGNSREASINLNTNVGDNDEDDVQEIRRPGGKDKARAARNNKWSKASGSSSVNEDALARSMVTEMTAQEKEQREKFLELKMREVECREREIATQEYRQE